MTGQVYMINHQMGWIAILTESNTFSIVEVLEYNLPKLGDIISGDIESLGRETLYNRTTNETIDVFIQDIYADYTQAKKELNIHENNKGHWEVLG